jgi:uncharacterized protein YbaR (Trm112 family)
VDPRTLRVVNCPCCKKMLFALSLDRSDAGATWQMTKDSPDVRQDREGNYLRCDNCMKRVAIEQAGPAGHARWIVSKLQKCDKTLS